ncbi:metallophosphoesterase family protein [Cellulomonas endophytica]|uniref:metallophosphoesterase family protein n=1 Tax=Cellulomonas endophytica TaxID=2494735 RepID=UPI001F0BAEF6|nr:metallophosphoesterase [Cellulomonas endophytica]
MTPSGPAAGPRRPRWLRPGAPDAPWNRPLHLPRWRRRSVARAVAAVLLGTVVALVVGVTTARTEASFGPHRTQYAVTVDGTVSVDLGPLGALVLDSPVPVLGVHAVVQEIPADLDEVDPATTLASLSEDAQRYVQFFSAPQGEVEEVVRGLVVDALRRAAAVLVVLALLALGLRALLGADRRRALAGRVAERRRAWGGGLLVALLVLAAVPASSRAGTRATTSAPVASAVFAGTPLEGARVTGRLGGVIDTLGRLVADAYRENEAFYAGADDALVVAWEGAERRDAAARAAVAAAAVAGEGAALDGGSDAGSDAGPGRDPGPDGGEDAGAATAPTAGVPAAVGEDGGGPASSPTPGRTAAAAPAEPVTVVVVSDLHCNVGMAPVISTLVRLSGADLVLDAGDTTVDGTAVEDYCVRTFARAVPEGVPLVTSPGNHDSATTSATYARSGATVLDGGVVEVAGLRVLGDHDPAETRIGAGGTALREPIADVRERLATTACEDAEGVDLLLVHTPAVGDDVLADGCAPAQVSGHLHTRQGPAVLGGGVRYVSSSTAGASLGQPTIGPLRGTAELTVLTWDPATRLFRDLRVVEVTPDGAVTVPDRVPWPALPPVDEPPVDEPPVDEPAP